VHMVGRVTQNMFGMNLLKNLNSNLSKLNRYSEQMSSLRKINRPSDDPVGISYSLRYRSDMAANSQYKSNLDSAQSFLDYTDTMLGQVTDVIHRIRELTVQGANGTNPDVSLDSIKNEIIQLKDQLKQIANSSFNGKYVFNGQLTNVKPYGDDVAPEYVTAIDTGAIKYEIGQGIYIGVNVTGKDVFGEGITLDENGEVTDPESDNLFYVVENIIQALANSDTDALNHALTRLDSRFDKLLEVRSQVGAKANRLDLAAERLGDIDINLQTLLSKTEDVDMAELIVNMKTAENAYQASLSAGARIIQPSLVDYLR